MSIADRGLRSPSCFIDIVLLPLFVESISSKFAINCIHVFHLREKWRSFLMVIDTMAWWKSFNNTQVLLLSF